jgi:hypothetical protein
MRRACRRPILDAALTACLLLAGACTREAPPTPPAATATAPPPGPPVDPRAEIELLYARPDHPISIELAELLDGLAAGDNQARSRLIGRLEFAKAGPWVPALVRALDDPYPPVVQQAAAMLGNYAGQEPGALDVDTLDRLITGKDGGGAITQPSGQLALGSLASRGPVASPIVARALVNYGPIGEEASSQLMRWRGDAAPAVPELIRLLDHHVAGLPAIRALGWIGPPAAEAVGRLEAIRQDDAVAPRRQAAEWALGQIQQR